MASHDDDRLDFRKLQRELDAAVEQDVKYWRENDAKIRAVTTQRVATYEEFKDLVAASHLKPLNKEDHIENIGKISKHPWNPAASCSKQHRESIPATQSQISQDMKIPKSGQDFARDWQQHVKSPKQRYAYLMSCGAFHLAKLFQPEISFGLLGDIITALTAVEKEDTGAVLSILKCLRDSNRFLLSLQFLNKQEKQACEQLFERLSTFAEEEGDAELKNTVSKLMLEYVFKEAH